MYSQFAHLVRYAVGQRAQQAWAEWIDVQRQLTCSVDRFNLYICLIRLPFITLDCIDIEKLGMSALTGGQENEMRHTAPSLRYEVLKRKIQFVSMCQ